MKEIKITPRVLEESFIPALEEVAQAVMPGKLAYAVSKNYKACMKLRKDAMMFRGELLATYGEKDEKGEFILEDDGQGHQVIKMSEENKAAFDGKIRDYYENELLTMNIHRVHESEFMDAAQVRPAALVMLAPMFFEEPAPVISGVYPDKAKSHMSIVKDEGPNTKPESVTDPNGELPS